MDIKLKRRLIVAIIILALVIIFVPMLFKQHENYAASDVVMTTPAIPPPASHPQQPKVAPPPASQNIAQMNNEEVKVIPAIAMPVSNQNEAKSPTIVQLASNQNEAKPQIVAQRIISSPVMTKTNLTNTMVAKPHIAQTNIKVTKIQPIQTKVDNPLRTPAHKLRNVSKKVKTIYLPKILIHHASAKTKAKSKPNKNAYVVQLGAFSHSGNANALIRHLRTNGFTSFGYKKKHAGSEIYTYVYVGPLVTHQGAIQMIRQLQKVMRMKGTIVPFDATKIY